jgi:hypothetical protein
MSFRTVYISFNIQFSTIFPVVKLRPLRCRPPITANGERLCAVAAEERHSTSPQSIAEDVRSHEEAKYIFGGDCLVIGSAFSFNNTLKNYMDNQFPVNLLQVVPSLQVRQQ